MSPKDFDPKDLDRPRPDDGGPISDLTLRDYFAAHAPIPGTVLTEAIDTSPHLTDAQPKLARWCYAWADAMIAERAR